MPSGASSHNGCCRTTLGCLGSQPAPISAPWKPGRYQIKKCLGPTYLWAWENKSTAHWCCGMQPMISYMCFPGFQGFFFIFPWEVIFPGLVFFNVHWPSHEKLSFPGFQGLFFMYIDHPMISYLSVASRAPLMHEHEKTFYYHRGIQIIIIIIDGSERKTCNF